MWGKRYVRRMMLVREPVQHDARKEHCSLNGGERGVGMREPHDNGYIMTIERWRCAKDEDCCTAKGPLLGSSVVHSGRDGSVGREKSERARSSRDPPQRSSPSSLPAASLRSPNTARNSPR